MKRYGFIGYGNMGRAVVLSLLKDGTMLPEQVAVYNRTPDRCRELTAEYPDVTVLASAVDVAHSSDVLFLCTTTAAVRDIMEEVSPLLQKGTHVVSINGGIRIADISPFYDGPVSKVIPTVTMVTGHGVTLIAHGPAVPETMQNDLSSLFQRSTKVRVMPEHELERTTDLTSCGPGLLAMITKCLVDAGARSSGLPRDEVEEMVCETLLGTALLLADGRETAQGVMEMVATKGGITEQGLHVLQRELPATFDRTFEATRAGCVRCHAPEG